MTTPVPPPTPAPRITFKLIRDIVLFTVGIGGIIYEVLVHDGQNTALLLLFSGMAGLPAFLYGDAKRAQATQPTAPPTSP